MVDYTSCTGVQAVDSTVSRPITIADGVRTTFLGEWWNCDESYRSSDRPTGRWRLTRRMPCDTWTRAPCVERMSVPQQQKKRKVRPIVAASRSSVSIWVTQFGQGWGVVEPEEISPSSDLITVQNLVAVSYRLGTRRRSQQFWMLNAECWSSTPFG